MDWICVIAKFCGTLSFASTNISCRHLLTSMWISISVANIMNTVRHWCRVRHICVSKLTIIGSDNGLSTGRSQTIYWINAAILSIGPLVKCQWNLHQNLYSISQEICTRFCCALLCCGYAIVHNEFTWSIYPYSSGLLCWHWGNR